MKKLIAISATIIALLIGSTAIVAQRTPRSPKKETTVNRAKAEYGTEARANRRYKYTYTTVKIVNKRHGKYRNTYLHTVFRNGREKVELIKSVRLAEVYPVRTRYSSKIVTLNGYRYRFVYKTTRYSDGRVMTVVHKRHRVR